MHVSRERVRVYLQQSMVLRRPYPRQCLLVNNAHLWEQREEIKQRWIAGEDIHRIAYSFKQEGRVPLAIIVDILDAMGFREAKVHLLRWRSRLATFKRKLKEGKAEVEAPKEQFDVPHTPKRLYRKVKLKEMKFYPLGEGSEWKAVAKETYAEPIPPRDNTPRPTQARYRQRQKED